MDQWQGVLPKGHSRHVSIYKTMNQRSFVSGDGLGVMYAYTIVQAIIYMYTIWSFCTHKRDGRRSETGTFYTYAIRVFTYLL